MNTRELVARLNVPAIRLALGRGGIPDLTNIDVAGALGMVQDEFAREVFGAIWWEDGAVLTRQTVARNVLDRILTERGRREKAVVIARLELDVAECLLVGRRAARSGFDEKVLADHRGAVDRAKSQTWPFEAGVYARLFDAVAREIRFPRHCPACRGRGELMIEKLRVVCEDCDGAGIKEAKKVARAAAIRVDEEAFRRTWFKIYNWVFSMIRDAETRGAVSFARALGNADD